MGFNEESHETGLTKGFQAYFLTLLTAFSTLAIAFSTLVLLFRPTNTPAMKPTTNDNIHIILKNFKKFIEPWVFCLAYSFSPFSWSPSFSQHSFLFAALVQLVLARP